MTICYSTTSGKQAAVTLSQTSRAAKLGEDQHYNVATTAAGGPQGSYSGPAVAVSCMYEYNVHPGTNSKLLKRPVVVDISH